jgi:DNA-binding transcriptional MocR family regulator
MGHNPTGILLSLERRKELYAVCSKYDVIIVEDDPYWYLQYPSAAEAEAASRNLPIPEAGAAPIDPDRTVTGYPFLDSMVPSFLRVDTDGRVVRLDTFSKTVAPGCRLGWVTAQPDLIERLVRVSETSTQQPSGFVQSLLSELVIGPQEEATQKSFFALRSARDRAAFAGWKMDGWVRWLEGLRGSYERRMQRMCKTLDEGATQVKQGTPVRPVGDAELCVVTKTTLYEFAWPRGGMFVWVRMNFAAHPLWQAVGSTGNIIDGSALCNSLMIFLTRAPYLVLVSPGVMFGATEDIRREIGWAYYRLCFAAETDENVDACSRRFVEGVHRFWKIKKVKELEELLEDFPSASAEEMRALDNDGAWLGC